MINFKKISIICGHYGSGKTNVAVNLALHLKSQGKSVTIIDLDIVNPYFRTADFKEMLEQKEIKVITPIYANTNLDIPALPPQINSALENNSDDYVIVDVGGDDAGAIALGRYASIIKQKDYDLFYVINSCRYLTQTPDEATELLRDIEYSSKIEATALINNSNLGELTTSKTITDSLDFANKISEQTNLPIALTCIDKNISLSSDNYFKVDVLVNKIWDK